MHETADSLKKQIADLEVRARDAQEEAEEARKLPSLDGPAEAAEAELRRLQATLRDMRLIQKRIEIDRRRLLREARSSGGDDACCNAASRQCFRSR